MRGSVNVCIGMMYYICISIHIHTDIYNKQDRFVCVCILFLH